MVDDVFANRGLPGDQTILRTRWNSLRIHCIDRLFDQGIELDLADLKGRFAPRKFLRRDGCMVLGWQLGI